jgi:membrane-associated PAP2 superfamily phosphatase
MNRTGLLVALSLSLAFVLLMAVFPDLDLWFARYFYHPETRNFPIGGGPVVRILREAAMIIAWAFCLPAIVAFIVKLARPDRPLLISGRTVAFFLITMTLTAGIVTNLGFKTHWGRPRPVDVVEFNGKHPFMPWWQPGGACPKNCSFFSGEAATAFWTYAPAALAPPQWRPLAYAGATIFGLATGLLRMTFGGHFFSDVVVAGFATFLIIWLVHGLIYRWPATRTSDARVDSLLTRWAWPFYAWRRGLFGKKPEAKR